VGVVVIWGLFGLIWGMFALFYIWSFILINVVKMELNNENGIKTI